MFGTNPIRKIDLHPADQKLAVQEIFFTLQGEGPLTGTPAVFIRLAGCHLACTFCDTDFESKITNRMTVHEVVVEAAAAALGSRRPYVVITGGEPLRQATASLVQMLIKAGFLGVQYETAGNLFDESLVPFLQSGVASIVCSPKTPHLHRQIIKYCRHYKYVVSAGEIAEDGLPSASTQANSLRRPARPWDWQLVSELDCTIWVSPCDVQDAFKNEDNTRAAVEGAMKFGYRLSLQTHKLLNLP